MGVELGELLQRSASAPPAPLDLDEVIDAGVRRRRRRRTARGASALVLVLVAVVAVSTLPRQRTELASPAARIDWPLAVRYDVEITDGGQEPRSPRVLELAAHGWDDWVTVGDLGDGRLGVDRFGPGRRVAYGEVGPAALLDEPFAALDALDDVDLGWDVTQEPVEGRMAPGPVLNPGYAGLLEQDPPAGAEVEEDLPELRSEVAERLGLDPDSLRSARVASQECWGEICGTSSRTSVWLPEIELPLYAEEVDPDGAVQRITATHLREGVAPPPNPAPAPPAVPEGWDEPLAPVQDGGLRWHPQESTVEWSIDSGWSAVLRIEAVEPDAAPPEELMLERHVAGRWEAVGFVDVGEPFVLETGGPEDPDAEVPPISGAGDIVRVPLGALAEPGPHRLRTPAGAVVLHAWAGGDPNAHLPP